MPILSHTLLIYVSIFYLFIHTFLRNLGIIDLQHYIKFRYTIEWFDTWIFYKMVTTINLVDIHHHAYLGKKKEEEKKSHVLSYRCAPGMSYQPLLSWVRSQISLHAYTCRSLQCKENGNHTHKIPSSAHHSIRTAAWVFSHLCTSNVMTIGICIAATPSHLRS